MDRVFFPPRSSMHRPSTTWILPAIGGLTSMFIVFFWTTLMTALKQWVDTVLLYSNIEEFGTTVLYMFVQIHYQNKKHLLDREINNAWFVIRLMVGGSNVSYVSMIIIHSLAQLGVVSKSFSQCIQCNFCRWIAVFTFVYVLAYTSFVNGYYKSVAEQTAREEQEGSNSGSVYQDSEGSIDEENDSDVSEVPVVKVEEVTTGSNTKTDQPIQEPESKAKEIVSDGDGDDKSETGSTTESNKDTLEPTGST